MDALERRDENGTEYVYAVRQVPSQDVAALLPEVLRGVIDGISWPKSCRWGTTTEMFSRPVRWLVALLGDTVIPVAVSYTHLQSSSTKRTSWAEISMPMASREPRYRSWMLSGEGLTSTWNW